MKLGIPGNHSPYRRLPELPMGIVFDESRSRIISWQENGKINSWGLKTGRSQLVARTDSLSGYCRAGQMLILNDGSNVSLADLNSNASRTIAGGPYHHVDWSKDCAEFTLADEDSKTVEIWKFDDLTKVASIQTRSPVRNGLAMSGDEKGMLRMWDVRIGEKITEGRTGLVIQSIAFSEDGQRLAITLWDSTIGIVDVQDLLD